MNTPQEMLEKDIEQKYNSLKLKKLEGKNTIIFSLLISLFYYTFLKHPIKEYFVIFMFWIILIPMATVIKLCWYIKCMAIWIHKRMENV